MSDKVSDTPRVDAAKLYYEDAYRLNTPMYLIDALVATRIEQDLNAANAEIADLKAKYAQRGLILEDLLFELSNLRAEVKFLRKNWIDPENRSNDDE